MTFLISEIVISDDILPVVMFSKYHPESWLDQMQHHVGDIFPRQPGIVGEPHVKKDLPCLAPLVLHAVRPGLLPQLQGQVDHAVPLHTLSIQCHS